MKIVAVHNGNFHADDVFAAATISLAHASELTFVRTRDSEALAAADFVIDVGGIYDESRDRFDHHQASFKDKRSNNIPYASFGLVWKKYGLVLCGTETVANDIDRELVQPIDAEDNGIELAHVRPGKPHPFSIANLVQIYTPTWKEDESELDLEFLRLVEWAKGILRRMIERSRVKHEADRFVRSAYDNAADKRIIILDEYYPAREVLSTFPEPLYVIRPGRSSDAWSAETVKDDPRTFDSRKPFPRSWAGKSGAELQKATGVADAMFCHKSRFLIKARSKEGIMRLAELAAETKV